MVLPEGAPRTAPLHLPPPCPEEARRQGQLGKLASRRHEA